MHHCAVSYTFYIAMGSVNSGRKKHIVYISTALVTRSSLKKNFTFKVQKVQKFKVQKVQNVLYCIYYKETQSNQKHVHTGVKQCKLQWLISYDIVHKEMFFMV